MTTLNTHLDELELTISQIIELVRNYDDAAKALVEAYGRRGYGVGDEVEQLERVLNRFK